MSIHRLIQLKRSISANSSGSSRIPSPMNTKLSISTLLVGTVLAFASPSAWSIPAPQSGTSAKQDMKNAGHDSKDAAKDAGNGVKKGTKKAYHSTKKGSKKAWNKTRNTAKGAVKGGKEGAQQGSQPQ